MASSIPKNSAMFFFLTFYVILRSADKTHRHTYQNRGYPFPLSPAAISCGWLAKPK